MMDEDKQAKMLFALAQSHIDKLGPNGATDRGINILADAVKTFTAFVKKAQERGDTSVEMTPEVVNAYNEMIWSTGLLVAIQGKKSEARVN